jgi:tetratricopeptide (TPR) repeat protein
VLIRPVLALLIVGCLWDHDTIRMEREAFPGIQELLAGKFTRHSRAYYEWRIEDRQRKLRDRPGDAALMDDLAVAFDKTGRNDEAVALMRASLESNPERYETLANLGTFLVHGGQFDEGLAFLRKAVEINPDAHFGREFVQIRLVEYVAAWRRTGYDGLPLCPAESRKGSPHYEALARCEPEHMRPLAGPIRAGFPVRRGFVGFETQDEDLRENAETLVTGLAGMMFFGRHDSPILAETLGDCLSELEHKRLACRAYLRAAMSAPDEAAQSAYRELARQSLGSQTKGGLRGAVFNESVALTEIEELFRDECEEGRAFFEEIAADERRWREEGRDLDEEFAKKYYAVGRTEDVSLPIDWESAFFWSLGAGFVFVAIRSYRRSKRNARPRKPKTIDP